MDNVECITGVNCLVIEAFMTEKAPHYQCAANLTEAGKIRKNFKIDV
jgi:hypothetical protein